MPSATYQVVIVGGGAGGLELAVKLGRRLGPTRVALLDKSAFHVWKPSLHEVAAGTLDIHREGLSYSMLAKDSGFTFIFGELTAVDKAERALTLMAITGEVAIPARTVAYETLVLALGSSSNFFNTPGAAENAIALDSTDQAERFRLKLLQHLFAVDIARETDPDRVLSIAIVGGGATGVELAAELREACHNIASYGLTRLKGPTDVHITILEGSSRILAPLPERVSEAAHALLTGRGITVKTGVRVASVLPGAVIDSQGNSYPANLCVWAAGIKAPEMLAHLGLATNGINQIVVNDRLATLDPHIMAFGDCAHAPGPNGKPLAARAQVAHQQASYLLALLSARANGKPEPTAPFVFKDSGSLVSIGQDSGVGSLMGGLIGKSLFLEGLFARLMYMSLHLLHHQAVLGTLRTAVIAVGRLMLRRSAPRVKLH